MQNSAETLIFPALLFTAVAEKPLLADIAPPQGTLVAVMLIYRRGSGIGGSKEELLGNKWYQNRQISKFYPQWPS